MNKVLMAAAAAGALLVSVSPAAAQQYGRPGYSNGYGYSSNYGNRTGYADNGYARRGNDWDQDENYRSHRHHHQNRHRDRDRDNRFERHDRRDRDREDR